jgi:hypothetical protein
VLVVTRTVEGTSTSVARRRVELSCTLPESHPGNHRDEVHGEEWEKKRSGGAARDSERPTILRHEDET